MTSEIELPESGQAAEDGGGEAAAPARPPERMPPVESRFLYVDVAARRAKQLRRGAAPRLAGLAADPETGQRPVPAVKLERIAMEEVDEGLIVYELPEPRPADEEGS